MNYPKINTLFKRDENNIIIPTEFTTSEFEYLLNNKWECTEKIDGTNIHVDFICSDNGNINMSINGRTDKSDIPQHLFNKIKNIFNLENITNYFDFKPNTEIRIFGEGYGCKIQKGGNYIKDDVNFILFDININGVWLKREDIEKISEDLEINIVPIIGYMTIPEAIKYVDNGFKSTISENKEYLAEGLVLKTPFGFKDRMGNRIITKIKTVDFIKLRNKTIKK